MLLLLLTLLWGAGPALAEGFRCAGGQGSEIAGGGAAKPARTAQTSTTGTRRALVIFARFKGDGAALPSWAADIFDPTLPGSFSHFYDTMSLGKLQVRGEAAARVYASTQAAPSYLSDDPTHQGAFGAFSLEILRQADEDLDFAQFDNDGPDGIPDSGDDDGVVDAVFLVVGAAPGGFILGGATGISNLGFEGDWQSADRGAGGGLIRVSPRQGTVQQGRSFAEAVGAMCHEYGHVLGLPDLFNTEFLQEQQGLPELDAAGAGAWDLMGWGALGWQGDDGPNSFSAWSRLQLGWAKTVEIAHPQEELQLPAVGREGEVYKIPLDATEYFLVEYRTRTSTYYDRHIPGEGLLVWHIAPDQLDLVCADGRWQDAGYPLGRVADPRGGGDNLDFWAHDPEYAQVHAGNLGDATDPFDGVRFRSFTPQTNPSSYNLAGDRSVRIEEIELSPGLARAQVQTAPAQVVLEDVEVYDANRDETLTPGEEASIHFSLGNQGSLVARNLQARLTTDDPDLEILQAGGDLGALAIGARFGTQSSSLATPRFRLKNDFLGRRQLPLTLEIYADGALATRRLIEVQAVSTYTVVGRVVDIQGRGVAGVKVSFGGVGRFEVLSGEGGYYEVKVSPGLYTAYLEPGTGRDLARRSVNVEVYHDRHIDIALVPVFEVTGVVRDEEGDPVANRSVSASGGTTGCFDSAITAEDGTFTLRLAQDTYDIRALVIGQPAVLPARIWPGMHIDGPRRLDLTLGKGVRCIVHVVGEEGTGIKQVGVGLVSSFSEASGNTNASGVAVLPPVPPGTYLFQFSRVPVPYVISAFAPVNISSDTTLQLVAQRGKALAGQVLDEEVRPFRAGLLTFLPQSGGKGFAMVFDAASSYATYLPPGRFEVVFEYVKAAQRVKQLVDTLTVEQDGFANFAVPSGLPVHGQVLAGDRQELLGVEVHAVSAKAAVAGTAQVQFDGGFGLALQPGSYQLAVAEHRALFWNLGTFEVPTADPLEVHLLSGASLSGQVADASGTPLENALVVLSRGRPGLVALDQRGFGFEAAVLSGAEGRFHLPVRPGTYMVAVLPERDEGVGMVWGEVAVSGDRPQQLTLPARGSHYHLQGQIADEPGMPRGEIALQFFAEEAGVLAQTRSSYDRGYGLDLPAGRYQVRAGLLSPVGGFRKIYDLGAVSIDRDTRWDIALSEAATAVTEEAAARPQGFVLHPNYPNPFNPTTTLRFSLPQPGEAELAIYNLLGQRVATLVRGTQEAGTHTLAWDGRDEQGRELGSGVYFCRLQAGNRVETRKLLLLR